MENLNVEQIKQIVKRKMEEVKEECFELANPQHLDYCQLSSSEKTLYDFCGQIDGYDMETLEKLNEIIVRMFYGDDEE